MKPVARYILLLLLAAMLIPYLAICFYALPFADDFCFGWTASENIPFVQKFLNQYLLWNGRYTADVLVNLHPLLSGKLLYYQLCSWVAIVAMPVVLYVFGSSLLQIQDPSLRKASVQNGKTEKLYIAICSLLITLLYLNYQPNITEGIYWYIGIANYHWGNLLVVVQLTLLLKALTATGKTKVILHTLSLLLLVIAIGFNEIGALLIPLFYCCLFAFSCQLRTADCRLWALYSGVAITASAFVFFSPGNFVRSHQFSNNYNLLHSAFYATLQTGRFVAKWLLNAPFLLLSAAVVAFAGKVKLKYHADYRVLLAAAILVVFFGAFLPYVATGVLGQHRTINYVLFFFLLLWLWFMYSVSVQYKLHEKLMPFTGNRNTTAVLYLAALLMLANGNYSLLFNDLSQHNFTRYKAGFMARQQAIVQTPNVPIAPLEHIPHIFTVVDVRSDTTWWVDKCMKNYYIETKTALK